jgi:hypothetical protein
LTWTERGGLYGGFVFQMVKEGYDDVLSLNIAKFPSHQYIIPWLEWLLSSGNQRVLVEHYDFVEMPGEGRTRKGLMIEGAGRKYWTMPDDISCSPLNNFVTQTITSLEKDVQQILTEELKKVF